MDPLFTQQASEIGTQQAAFDYKKVADKSFSSIATPVDKDAEGLWNDLKQKHEANLPGWHNEISKDYDITGYVNAFSKAQRSGATFVPEVERLKYHKPNSPFFNDQSVHYKEGMEAGTFAIEGGAATFKPSPFMVAMHGRDNLEKYYEAHQKEWAAEGRPFKIAWPKMGGDGKDLVPVNFYGNKVFFPNYMSTEDTYRALSRIDDQMKASESYEQPGENQPVGSFQFRPGTDYIYMADGTIQEKDKLASQIAGYAKTSAGLVSMAPAWFLSLGVNAILAASETFKEAYANDQQGLKPTGMQGMVSTFGKHLHDTKEFANKFGNALFDPDAFMEVTGLQKERDPNAADYYAQKNVINDLGAAISYLPGKTAEFLAKHDYKGAAWIAEEGINLALMGLLHTGVTYPKKIMNRMTVRDALRTTPEGKVALNNFTEVVKKYAEENPEKAKMIFHNFEKYQEKKFVDSIIRGTKHYNERGGPTGGPQPSGWWEGSENKKLNLTQGTVKMAEDAVGSMKIARETDIKRREEKRESEIRPTVSLLTPKDAFAQLHATDNWRNKDAEKASFHDGMMNHVLNGDEGTYGMRSPEGKLQAIAQTAIEDGGLHIKGIVNVPGAGGKGIDLINNLIDIAKEQKLTRVFGYPNSKALARLYKQNGFTLKKNDKGTVYAEKDLTKVYLDVTPNPDKSK
jgi:hypothetical protein